MSGPTDDRRQLSARMPARGLDAYVRPDGDPEPIGVPLGKFAAVLRRHALVIVFTVAAGVGGAGALIWHVPNQYSAAASILMEPQRTQVSDLQAMSPEFDDTASLIQTQIDILRSPTLARSVVKALDLQDDPVFTRGSGTITARISTWLHQSIRRVARFVNGAETAQQNGTQDPIELTAARLDSRLSFANEPHSRVLQLAVTTQNPKLSAKIANEIANKYLQFKRREKFSTMQRTSAWFQSQLGGLGKKVRREEEAAERYRARHGLVDLPPRTPGITDSATSVTHQELQETATQLGKARRSLAKKQAELAQAERALRDRQTSALPEVLVSPVVTQLVSRLATVEGEEAGLAASQGSRNPELIAAQAKSRKVRAAIMHEMANIVHSLKSRVNAAQTQVGSLQSRMHQLIAAVRTENMSEIGLRSLEDKARATRTIYENFLSRATELDNAVGIQQPDATLVSAAVPPLTPSAPRRVRLLGVAAVVFTALGVALATGIERARRGFSSPDEVEAALKLPVLTMTPKLPRAVRKAPLAAPQAGEFAVAMCMLRSRLRLNAGPTPSVVMVSSALPDEGKSILAAGFATDAASAGWRVLLIECDFHRPTLARQLRLPTGPGLGELLESREAIIGNSVIREVKPRLDVILSGKPCGDGCELLGSRHMQDLLAVARNRYDLVILDTPPLLPRPDALVLAQWVDTSLLAVRWEKTPQSTAQDAIRLLRETSTPILGTVLTQVNLRTSARLAGRPTAVYDYSRFRA